MADTKSIMAILSAKDQNFTSTMNKAMGALGRLGKAAAKGVGFGSMMAVGQKAVSVVGNGVRSLISDMDKTNAAWNTFNSNMKAAGHSSGEIKRATAEMKDFASKSIYYSSDMASTYAQLDAVGTKNTANLVKGFGAVASAAENPTQAMQSMSQQATQMAAKPLVAWQDFKIMMEQTPAGISQVAKQMGMTTKQLVSQVQDIKNGGVKTEEFFKAIAKIGGDANHQLMKNATQYKTIGEAASGTAGFLMTKLSPAWSAVSKAAIGALGGIQGRIAKLDPQEIKKKVVGGIEKAKEIFNDAKPAIKAFGSAIMTAGRMVASAIPYLAKLAPVLVPAFAAFKGYKKISPAITAVTGFANVWQKMGLQMAIATAKGGASSSQMIASTQGVGAALKMLVSPTGLAVAGFAALLGAVGAVQSHMAKIPGTWQNVVGKMREASLASDEAARSFKELQKSEHEQINAGMAEVAHIQEQKKELDGLVSANGRVKKGAEAKVKTLVNSISKATGVELEFANGVVKGYERAGAAIDKYIEKKRAQIQLDGHEQSYKKAIENQDKYVASMREAQRTMDGINSGEIADKNGTKMIAASQKYKDAADHMGEANKTIEAYEAAEAAYKDKKYAEVESTYQQHINKVDGLNKQSVASLKKKNTEEQAELQAALNVSKQLGDEGGAAAERMVQSSVQKMNATSAALQGYTGLKEAIEKIGAEAGQSVPKSVSDGIKAGQYILPTTALEMQNLIQFDTLATKAGKAGQDTVRSLKTKMLSGKMSVGEAVNMLSTAAASKFKNIPKEGKRQAGKATSGVAAEANKGKTKIAPAFEAMTNTVTNSFKKMPKSVKVETGKIGVETGKGIKSGEGKVKTAGSGIMSKIKSIFSKGASTVAPTGKQMTAGVASGMNSAASLVEAAAARIVAAAERAAAAKAKIGSPSKLFAVIGGYITEGFANGITGKSRLAYSAGAGIAIAADDGVTSEAEIHSPSKKAKRRGAAIALGLANGLKAKAKVVANAAKSLLGSLRSTMASATKKHNFTDTAQTAMDAYRNKLAKSSSKSTASVNKAIALAQKKARKRIAKEQKRQLKATKSNKRKKAIRKNTAKQRKAITAWGSAVKKTYSKQIKAQQNQAIKGAEKEMNALASKYQAKYDAIAEARSTFLDRLRSYGELYSKDSYGFFKLTDFNALSKQIDVIKNGLQKLQKWGVSQNFINQITQMEPSQQQEFLSHLIALGKKGATDYAKSFDAYWKKAGDVSTSIYKPYVDALDTQYNKELAKVMAKLKKKMDEIGKQTSKGLVNGLKDKSTRKQLDKAAASLAKIMVATIKKKLKIKSPSRVMEDMMMYVGKGMVKGLEGSERGVANAMDNLVQLPTVRVPEMKSAVGAELSSDYSYGTSVEYTINVPLEINGKKFAEATASSMEDVLNKRQMRMNRKSGIR